MDVALSDRTELARAAFDSVSAHIAVIDEGGVIVAANEAWRRFAQDNEGEGKHGKVGENYLDLCQASAELRGDAAAAKAGQGVRDVLGGAEQSFSIEYAFQVPARQRWFVLKVGRLEGGPKRAVVVHEEITEFHVAREFARRVAARQQRQAEVVSTIASSPLLAAGALPELAVQLTAAASVATGVERVGVWLFERQGTQLVSVDIFDATSGKHTAGVAISEDCYRNEFAALKSSKYVDAHDARTDPRTVGYVESYLLPNGITSMLDAVIRAGGKTLGVLCFECVGQVHHWENDEITFACQLADQLALTLANQERRTAELALQESEARFRSFFELHAAAMLAIDPETGEIVDANEAAVRFYGWSIGQLRRMRIQEINTLPPERSNLAIELARRGEQNRFEFRHRTAGGTVREVEVFSARVDTGGKPLLFSIIHDVSERKQAEAEALAKTQELDRYFTSSLDLLCIADTSGHFLRVNPEWERVLGYSLAELEGRSFLELVHPEDLASTLAALRRLEGQETILNFENRYRCKEGAYRWIEWRSIPRGQIIYAVARDITARKEAEEALFRSQQLLQLVLDSIPQGVFWKDLNSVYLGCNRAAARDSGAGEPAAMVGKSDRDLAWGVRSEIYRADDRQVMASGIAKLNYEEKVVLPNGEVRWWQTSKIPLRDQSGKVFGVLSTYQDTTRQKVLREAEVAKLSQVVAQTPASVVIANLTGRIEYVNPAFTTMTGYSPAEILGRNLRMLKSGLMDERVYVEMWNTLRAGQIWRGELQNRAKDGSLFWALVVISPVKNPSGRVTHYAAVGGNITEQKRAEEALRESEEKFRAVSQSANDAIILLDNDGRVSFWNKAAERILGYSFAEAIGMDLHRCLAPARFHEPQQGGFARFRSNGEGAILGRSLEFAALRKDGVELPVELSVSAVRLKGQWNAVGILRDISERKRQEAEKTMSLNRMASAIAHNFNNQLQAITMSLEMAATAAVSGSGIAQNLSAALRAANKAATLSSLMLTYLGQRLGDRVSLDLAELCRQYLPALQAAKPGSVRLEADFPAPGPTVQADAEQLRQVLAILSINAWEACGEQPGTIRFRVRTVAPGEIPGSQRWPLDWEPKAAAYACLEVTDDGSGIVSENLKRVFDPFFTTKFTGRGLGLPVVLGTARSLNGAVSVESEPGRGSCFRLFIPVSEEASPQPPPAPVPTPDIEWSGTILLVDDEHPVRLGVGAALTRMGFTVLEARDGVEALELFLRTQPNTIRGVICDLTMPRMDGWETLTALRKHQPDLPVILTSGHDQSQVMAGDHPERPQAFLHKPFMPADLRQALRQALANK